MFERYTEKARRSIFFARYEASELGGSCIETEHLLLGLLRENKALVLRYLPAISVDEVRKSIELRSTPNTKVPTSVDLALSDESKRVLAYAAEEAQRLARRHIGTEHLLLGLLRERDSFAAQLLRQYGVELATLRLEMAKTPCYQSTPGADDAIILIRGNGWDVDYVKGTAEHLRKFFWHKQRWAPVDIVVHRNDGRVSFDLKLAGDSSQFELKQRHFRDDSCAICHWQFSESGGDEEHTAGYSNGREWLCSECY